MKITIKIFAIFLIVMFASCKKDNGVTPSNKSSNNSNNVACDSTEFLKVRDNNWLGSVLEFQVPRDCSKTKQEQEDLNHCSEPDFECEWL